MTAKRRADTLSKRLAWKDLDPEAIKALIRIARLEDLAGWGLAQQPAVSGDVTSSILSSADCTARARLVTREDLVVCGLPLVPMVLDAYGKGAQFEPVSTDGHSCSKGDLLGILSGPSGILLQAERVILNFLQRLSGIASTTQSYVRAMGTTRTRLLDTRKTTPGYRVLEKYAVACGGGYNHRIGLFDRVMLKDNHLASDRASAGDALAGLVGATREKWPDMVIELEVDNLQQIAPGLSGGVDVFLLDNFPKEDLVRAIEIIGSAAATEASGGITIDTLPQIACIGLDFISTGATVHQSTWKDIALDWEETTR